MSLQIPPPFYELLLEKAKQYRPPREVDTTRENRRIITSGIETLEKEFDPKDIRTQGIRSAAFLDINNIIQEFDMNAYRIRMFHLRSAWSDKSFETVAQNCLEIGKRLPSTIDLLEFEAFFCFPLFKDGTACSFSTMLHRVKRIKHLRFIRCQFPLSSDLEMLKSIEVEHLEFVEVYIDYGVPITKFLQDIIRSSKKLKKISISLDYRLAVQYNEKYFEIKVDPMERHRNLFFVENENRYSRPRKKPIQPSNKSNQDSDSDDSDSSFGAKHVCVDQSQDSDDASSLTDVSEKSTYYYEDETPEWKCAFDVETLKTLFDATNSCPTLEVSQIYTLIKTSIYIIRT
jgi:hypothetical protein